MNKSEQIKSLCITVEDQSNVINKMTAEIGNYDVQIAEYRQIIQELSNKLRNLNFIDQDGKNIDRFFHQLKFHGTQDEANILWDEGKCFLQSYNVFWDTTGHELNNKSYCKKCN